MSEANVCGTCGGYVECVPSRHSGVCSKRVVKGDEDGHPLVCFLSYACPYYDEKEDRMLDVDRLYRFPSNSRAEAEALKEQIYSIMCEADEVFEADFDSEGSERIIEELWDVIHAAEGALRKFKPQQVRDGYYLTLTKCNRRGNYTAEAMQSDDWGL